ncbi:hypothetical protein V2J09_019234 [Rumex salicifolius]
MDRGGGDYYSHYHHHHQSSPEGSSRSSDVSNITSPFLQPTPPLSRYESQKRRDWNTFGQYLKNQRPPVPLSQCTCNHVLDFLRYLDQFGKTKVHLQGCIFYGQPDPPAPCACPLRQAWGSLDALIGRLRAAYEENGGSPETNPFASSAIRVFLREVRECQAKARGIPYKKQKKKTTATSTSTSMAMGGHHSPSSSSSSGNCTANWRYLQSDNQNKMSDQSGRN